MYNETYANDTEMHQNDTWKDNINTMVGKIEGLAHAFISELQDLKHFVQGEDSVL